MNHIFIKDSGECRAAHNTSFFLPVTSFCEHSIDILISGYSYIHMDLEHNRIPRGSLSVVLLYCTLCLRTVMTMTQCTRISSCTVRAVKCPILN